MSPSLTLLRLASGGRVAVRSADVAAAQASPWGSVLLLASDGSRFEVEHTLEALRELLPSLWFVGGGAIFNPDHIVSIWEEDNALHYRLAGGLEMTQTGTDLHQFTAALDAARADRRARGLD